MRIFDTKPQQPSTEILLDLYSANARIILPLADIPSHAGFVEFQPGDSPPQIEHARSCLSTHLIIRWNRARIRDTLNKSYLSPPSAVSCPIHLKFTLAQVLAAPHIIAIMIGKDSRFSTFVLTPQIQELVISHRKVAQLHDRPIKYLGHQVNDDGAKDEIPPLISAPFSRAPSMETLDTHSTHPATPGTRRAIAPPVNQAGASQA